MGIRKDPSMQASVEKDKTLHAKSQKRCPGRGASGKILGGICGACVRISRRLSHWRRGREKEMIEETADRSQQAHLVGPPGPGVEWGLICANALICCEDKFLHLTLGIGDHLLSAHIHAPCFVKIAEMPIV